jgi:hypothetical protein
MIALQAVWNRVYLVGAVALLLLNACLLLRTGWVWSSIFLCYMTQTCFYVSWQSVGLVLQEPDSRPRWMKIANYFSAVVFPVGLAYYACRLIMTARA